MQPLEPVRVSNLKLYLLYLRPPYITSPALLPSHPPIRVSYDTTSGEPSSLKTSSAHTLKLSRRAPHARAGPEDDGQSRRTTNGQRALVGNVAHTGARNQSHATSATDSLSVVRNLTKQRVRAQGSSKQQRVENPHASDDARDECRLFLSDRARTDGSEYADRTGLFRPWHITVTSALSHVNVNFESIKRRVYLIQKLSNITNQFERSGFRSINDTDRTIMMSHPSPSRCADYTVISRVS